MSDFLDITKLSAASILSALFHGLLELEQVKLELKRRARKCHAVASGG